MIAYLELFLAFLKVGLPGPVQMRFDSMFMGKGAWVIRLRPADERQEKLLWDFRDRAADALGLRLPGHGEYRFHISLGYVRVIPEGEVAEKAARLKERVDAYIAAQPAFWTAAPYMAYYDDMYAFSPHPIPR